jgi:energy-converting hydrogenase Eha subunit C
MKLTPPATATWLIAVILGVVGILLHQHVLHFRLGIESFWLLAAGFILLAVGSLVRGL